MSTMDDEQTNYASSFDMTDYHQSQEISYNPSGMNSLPPSSSTTRVNNTTTENGIHGGHDHRDSHSQLDIDALQRMFDFVGDPEVANLARNGPSATPTTTTATSDVRTGSHGESNSNELIQHMQLQHYNLQQMQNQIIHQQMELMKLSQHLQNGHQLPVNTILPHPHHFPHGLPTPINSTNLPAQIQPDVQHSNLVSPMIPMDNGMYEQPPRSASSSTTTSPNPFNHSMSAPARLAFVNNGVPPLPSPASMDYDLPPIPSPWLGPLSQGSMPNPSDHVVPSSDASRKRTNQALGNVDVQSHTKRQSPIVPTVGSGTKRGPRKPSASANSTPMMAGTPNKRRKSVSTTPVVPSSCTPQQQPPIDTPSPVDISMPPPAVPESKESASPTPTTSPKGMEPVTPSSIMGLMPPGSNIVMTPILESQRTTRAKSGGKGKSVATGASISTAASSSSSSKPSTRRGSNARNTITNPGLKTLLPDGVPPPSPVGGSHSNSYNGNAHGSHSMNNAAGVPPKKTSHKAAEQKRRDSLKTTFDDLRMLLPPIPLPSEDGYAATDEPPLPGSLPPRGPPKGEPEGPNRHVSKLQLLRCGNDFIRQLKGRVDRRDEEITRLRSAILRLREKAGDGVGVGVDEEIDLERDLDAVEREAERARRSRGVVADEADGEDDGDDE